MHVNSWRYSFIPLLKTCTVFNVAFLASHQYIISTDCRVGSFVSFKTLTMHVNSWRYSFIPLLEIRTVQFLKYIPILYLLLPGTSFPLLQGLLIRSGVGLLLMDLLVHHKIDLMFYIYQLICKFFIYAKVLYPWVQKTTVPYIPTVNYVSFIVHVYHSLE